MSKKVARFCSTNRTRQIQSKPMLKDLINKLKEAGFINETF